MKIDWVKWAKMEAESGQGIYCKNNNPDGLFWSGSSEVVWHGQVLIDFEGRTDKVADNFIQGRRKWRNQNDPKVFVLRWGRLWVDGLVSIEKVKSLILDMIHLNCLLFIQVELLSGQSENEPGVQRRDTV